MIDIFFDANKSIEELENDYWTDTDILENCSTFERRIYALRRKPLKELEPKELRMLMGQNIGNEYTVPLSLNILEKNHFFECDFYPGDLLVFAIHVETEYWVEHKEMYENLNRLVMKYNADFDIINENRDVYEKISDEIKNDMNIDWETARSKYLEKMIAN